MLSGLDVVVGREGSRKMRRLVGMSMPHHVVEARGLISRHAVHTAVAYDIGNRRDAITGLDRGPGPIGHDPVAKRRDAPAHLMTRHDPAVASDLALPHMDFGAAHVGLGHLGYQCARLRRGNLVLMKLECVRAGDESDFTDHNAVPVWARGLSSLDERSVPRPVRSSKQWGRASLPAAIFSGSTV
jgi:hypothetical protein